MTLAIISFIYFVYMAVAWWVMRRISKDVVLRRHMRMRDDREWEQFCVAEGLTWPFSLILSILKLGASK